MFVATHPSIEDQRLAVQLLGGHQVPFFGPQKPQVVKRSGHKRVLVAQQFTIHAQRFAGENLKLFWGQAGQESPRFGSVPLGY